MYFKKSIKLFTKILIMLLLILSASYSYAASPAGYSEYYIPGPEDNMYSILDSLDQGAGGSRNMHAVIDITAYTNNTTVYYDNWEDGYDFDPQNPATADETYTINQGQTLILDSANMARPRSGSPGTSPSTTCTYTATLSGTVVRTGTSTTCYDGRDRIYVAGGVVTVTRVGWIEGTTIGMQSVAWEIYPVKPQLTTYVVPFGEATAFAFARINTLIQATQNNTTFTIDLNDDSIPDRVDQNGDGLCNGSDSTTITLAYAGDTFLLNDATACYGAGTLPAGIVIQGDKTLQVKYITGNTSTATYVTRGLSAFPRGYWTKDYYAPLDQPANPTPSGTNDYTDYFLYNPWLSAIIIDWEASGSSGSFSIPARSTVSFRSPAGANRNVPTGSGLYFRGSDTFWGVGLNDATQGYHEWGYSLLPSTMLYEEHFLGWAPGSIPVDPTGNPGTQHYDGVFLTAAQDNMRVFVDFDNNGTADMIDADLNGTPESPYLTLNRLQNQYIYNPNTGDLSGTHFWATGPFSLAYGENSNTASQTAPALDVGYVGIPGSDFVSLVLTVDKSVSPQVVSTASGSTAVFTLKVNSQKYTLDGGANGVIVTDYLPPNWDYVTGTTIITRPDKTTVSGGAADPTKSATAPYTLSWTSAQLGTNGTPGMAENQEVTITFTARTTTGLAVGTLSQNRMQAVGKRTFGIPVQTQTFTATDYAYVASGDIQIAKTSNAATPLYPGNTFTYTVTVTNPASATSNQTGISIYDPLPAGVSYVAGSAQVTGWRTTTQTDNVQDNFSSQAYNNNNGSVNWLGNWVETDPNGGSQSATAGNVQITGNQLRLGPAGSIYRQVDLSSATSATLTLDYSTNALDNPDTTTIEIGSSSSGPWSTALTFTNDQNGTLNYTIPTNRLTSTTTVRITATGYTGNNEYLYIDNVDISYTHTISSSGTSSAGNPPNFVSSSAGYSLAPGQQMTLTYNVTVDNPLASGITGITNTAYVNSSEIILPLSASVTNIVVNPSSQSASVGDRVWFDIDGDAVLDIGEPGLTNVEVTLKDQFGTPVMTTTTDAIGHYQFVNVQPGTGYYVEVSPATLPAGLLQTAPAGRSDNRTKAFNLTEGQSYLEGDIGYGPAPGTATFGDLVWSDFDNDGVRDLGEPGLAGITVQLWRDTDGDLLLNTGTDLLISTTVTAAGGNYLFTGVPATGTQDYLFFVDPSQAGLTGFTETTVNPLLSQDVSSGNVIVNLDFGFLNATGTFTLKDRVWYDANADSQDDGESGIAGITVDLLDTSFNVIASTITDADGYFLFNGVIGAGADYSVRITDTGSILSDYYGITSAAITGTAAINNLGGNLDFTAEPSEPNFGYGLSKSVSGRVFNDLDGDGSLDAGEPGIGGIGVSLYNDVNGNGLLDGGDTLKAVLPTDSNGNYLFSGLNNGKYIVSIPTPPSGYTYTTETPDNDPAAGDQQPVTIATGSDVQTVFFGYAAQSPRSVSGTVWKDINADGFLAGETGIGGVTVDLLNGSTVVASATTDTNGNYSFSGLTPALYTVRITDSYGVLAGYEPTYEFDAGITGPFDGMAAADLSGGSLTAADFGYRQGPVITLAAIADFKASVIDGSVVVSWETVYEKGTIGFSLYRLDEASGEYVRVNTMLIPGLIFAPRGGSYRVVDSNALPGRTYSYLLVEVEARNLKEKRNTYGPFRVTAQEAWGQYAEVMPASAQFTRREHPVPESTKTRLAARSSSLFKNAQMNGTPSARITALAVNPFQVKRKLGVNENGLFYLEFSQLPFVRGIGPRSNAYAISSQMLLKNKGQQIPYFIADDNKGIYFYGEGLDSIYSDENVYWAERGRGTLMQAVNGTGPLPAAGDQTFPDTVHIEEDTLPILAVVTDPNSDYWTWGEDFIYAEYPGYDLQTFNFFMYGVAAAPADESASLTVHLYGLTDTEHHARIWLNNEYIGEGRWSGIRPESFTFPVSQTLLKDAADGENAVIVKGVLDAGVPYTWITVDSFDIRYHRKYQALDDALFVTGGVNQTVTVEGFSNQTIFVFDLSDPTRPKRMNALTIDSTGPGNYRVSFVPLTPQTRYFVTSVAGLKAPAFSSIDNPSSLMSRFHKAAYLLITPGDLKATAESLARHRQQQGFPAEIVDIEDIMDEFNYGNFSPEAIRSFLTFAYKNWFSAPRYAVLIGEGTYDYKDFSGMGGNLIPPIMVTTPDGLVASDTALADVNGDHLPEIAIGRLPVLTAEELQTVIEKIRTYENASDKSWRNHIVMTADHPEEEANFPLDSDSVAALLPSTYLVSKIYMSQQSLTSARTLLMNALQNGTGLINYIGHGGPDRLEQDGLLQNSDVALMTNARLPLLTAMTCVAGDFSHAGYDSLAELLFIKQGGGAIAIWAPAGYSNNAEAVVMDKEFIRSSYLTSRPARTLLGDVVLESLGNAKKNGVSDYMLEIYNIIGDPALMLK